MIVRLTVSFSGASAVVASWSYPTNVPPRRESYYGHASAEGCAAVLFSLLVSPCAVLFSVQKGSRLSATRAGSHSSTVRKYAVMRSKHDCTIMPLTPSWCSRYRGPALQTCTRRTCGILEAALLQELTGRLLTLSLTVVGDRQQRELRGVSLAWPWLLRTST